MIVTEAMAIRRQHDREHRRRGWLMVPSDYIDQVKKIVADSFDAMEDAIEQYELIADKKIDRHPALLKLTESLEEKIIKQVVSKLYAWGCKQWNSSPDEENIITNEAAYTYISQLVAGLFANDTAKIYDFSLVDRSDPVKVLALLEFQNLEERIRDDLISVIDGWR
jgi:hypothetical protein